MAKKAWQRSRIVPVIWATALLYTPLAQALGLGRLTVLSDLGQPLRAEIPLVAFHGVDRSAITAKLASTGDFAQVGLRKSRALRGIVCHIRRNANGHYVVMLQSPNPVDVPFLHFLLSLKWSNGSLLREYTALLNPASGVTTVGLGPSTTTALARSLMPATHRSSRRGTRRTTPATEAVRAGQTLWVLAARAAPSSQAMAQTLEAFLQENPQAFLHHNVNDLRAGAILKVPARQTILATSVAHATAWLSGQNAAWAQYRTELAQSAAPSSGRSRGISGSVQRGALFAASGGALKIEPAHLKAGTLGEGTSAGGAHGSLVTRINRLQQELQKTKRLMTLENQELALLQKRSGQSALRPVVAGAISQGRILPASRPVVAVPARAPGVVHTGKPVVVRHFVRPAAIPPLPPQPSFLASLMNSERVPLGALLVILLVGGGLLIQRRRRTMAEFEESILSGGGLNSEGHMADTAGLPKTPEVSFLSEFSQAGGIGAMHTDEVDPLAEADVYLAYGRDEQAEEILKEAVIKDGARLELKLKLLEIYFQRNDIKTFEIVAEEVYAASSGQGALWKKVEDMGRKLDPAHPLFKRGAAAVATLAVGSDEQDETLKPFGMGDRIDFAAVARELDEVSTPRIAVPSADPLAGDLEWVSAGTKTTISPPASEIVSEDDQGLDFSLDLSSPSELLDEETRDKLRDSGGLGKSAKAEAMNSQADDLKFEWNSLAGVQDDVATKHGTETPDNEFAIQFDEEDVHALTLTSADLEFTQASSQSPMTSGSLFEVLGDGSLEEGGDIVIEAEEDDRDVDAVETKLELARAYIEMGDSEGARVILDEVLTEGNESQRATADRLIAGTI